MTTNHPVPTPPPSEPAPSLRPVEEIRGDLGTVRIARSRPEFADLGASAADRLAADVEPLLDRLAAADGENAELRGEVAALTASLHEKDDHTPSAKRSADYWLRMLQACEAERDQLRGEVDGFKAENRWVWDRLDVEIDKRCAAEGRLELGRAALIDTGYFTEDEVGRDIGPRITELHSAMLAAPQPEPALVDCRVLPNAQCVHEECRRDVEPPASDEPARCEHGFTAWHWVEATARCAEWRCSGPTATQAPGTCHGTGSAAGGGL